MHSLQNLKSLPEWKNWKWQIQNRITSLSKLKEYLVLKEEEEKDFSQVEDFFNFGVTPYYLSLANPENPNCPIKLQAIPRKEELLRHPLERIDPLGEEAHMPVKGVTHRYPDRALWYLSHQCAVFCRFCTRKRKVGNSEETPRREDWDAALAYFHSHKELREVILSGGDPLTLNDSQLDYLLSELKKIGHLNHVRIHTRYPVTLPFRITPSLCDIFRKHFPIFIVTHFNHAAECSPEAREAARNLIQIGNCTVLNQSVLLKNVNDDSTALKNLNYSLVSMGIKPYYLHQCDEVFGSSHFRVPIKTGVELMKNLRGHISGVAVPSYVADLTGGGGKVPLPTDYLQKEDVEKYTFKNFKGDYFDINK